MNNILRYRLTEFLDRAICAFHSAHAGPDPDGADQHAPNLEDYTLVLQGQKLFLSGVVTGHPRLGTDFVRTSMLIHVTDDEQWARTLSRWYRLGERRHVDTSQLSPDLVFEGYCPAVGASGLGIPVRLARTVMAGRPSELSRIALEKGLDEHAVQLAQIAKNWPPEANKT